MASKTDTELWQDKWTEWYALKEEVRKVNVQLVEIKMRLRAQGLPYPRPAGPRPVAA